MPTLVAPLHQLGSRVGRCLQLPPLHALAFAMGTHRRLGAGAARVGMEGSEGKEAVGAGADGGGGMQGVAGGARGEGGGGGAAGQGRERKHEWKGRVG